MRTLTIGLLAASAALAGCTEYGDSRPGYYDRGYSQYDYDRPDPAYNGYDASRYYREDSRRYREQQLGSNDRVYRGSDGRYYCRRQDGSTGLVVGAAVGGLLGNVIAPNGSKLLGTILGAGGGAAVGAAVDSDNNRNRDMRCR